MWWLAGSVASLIPVVTDHVEGFRSGRRIRLLGI